MKDVIETNLSRCLLNATQALLQHRNRDGYWEGRLASSPLATAVALCAFADEENAPIDRILAQNYLLKAQNLDGGWGDTEISKSNLTATVLVLCANSVPPHLFQPALPFQREEHRNSFLSEDQHRRAEAYVEKLGGLREGLQRVYGQDLTFQVPIRMTAAFSGLRTRDSEPFPWCDVNALPFELALAPRSLMGALRLPVVSYALPALVCVGLARHRKQPSWFPPLRWFREWIADRALELILKMQPESGGYLEAIPITAFCLIGLKTADRAVHPVARNARRFLIESQREDGGWPVEINLSVWNTTRAIDALAAGDMLDESLSENERAVTREWLLARQAAGVSVYSDARPGGWGWNHLSGSVPDADDTSGAMIALRHLGLPEKNAALQSGKKWLLNIQNRDGGWPTFCRGWQKLPFDRSAADLTAHALRAFNALGNDPCSAETAGWKYLRRVQRPDGSFVPLWFGCEAASDQLNATYATTHVLLSCFQTSLEGPIQQFKSGLLTPHRTAGVPPAMRKLVDLICNRALLWLRSIQNTDGGFGGCAGATSTAEETGMALRALVESGTGADTACQRAAHWLITHQREDGSWQPAPIGFYFAVLWYYEELYPLCYALGGLGAWARHFPRPLGESADVSEANAGEE